MTATNARPTDYPGSISERTDQSIQIADRTDARHVFIARFDVEARATATAIDMLRQTGARPLFCGITATIKGNIDVAGYVTSAGSSALQGQPAAEQDADVVARLRQTGHVLMGHSNMTELAFSGLGINPHFGTPANPAFPDESRIPGGSSSGGAVSVALGIAQIAIGTDTGGSVRIPAALCGLVGFKPTGYAVSRKGVTPLSVTLDSVGVMARSVGDCSQTFEVIRDHRGTRRSCVSADPRRIRLGIIEHYVSSGLMPEVAQAYQQALARLANAGFQLEVCPFPELLDMPEILRHGTFPGAESFAHFSDLLSEHAALIDPFVRGRIEAGGAVTGKAYLDLLTQRARLMAVANERIREFDAWVMPTVPMIAPLIGDLGLIDAYRTMNLLALRNPTVVNFFGGCAITVPCHSPNSAPVGLTLAHAADRDDDLLRVAALVEAALRC